MGDISIRVRQRPRLVVAYEHHQFQRAVSDLWDQGVSRLATPTTFSRNMLNSLIFSYNRNNGTIISGAPFSFPSLGFHIAAYEPPEFSSSVSGYFTIGSGHPRHVQPAQLSFLRQPALGDGATNWRSGGDFMRMDVDISTPIARTGNIHSRHAPQRQSACRFSGWLYANDSFREAANSRHAGESRQSVLVQDNYRVCRNLMLNLGLRWDPFVPYNDEEGRNECFRPGMQSTRFPNAPTGYLFAGDTVVRTAAFNLKLDSSSLPALDLLTTSAARASTTIRGGWGLFYQPPFVEAFNNMVG